MGLLYVTGYGYLALPIAPHVARTLFAMGFVAGGSFSTYLGLAYRNKRFEELRPRRFALVGSVFAGLLVPGFSFVPGMGMFLGGSFYEAMAWSVALAAALGGVTAYSTVKIAQAAALSPGTGALEDSEIGVLIPEGGGGSPSL
jgi:hypothetical protein